MIPNYTNLDGPVRWVGVGRTPNRNFRHKPSCIHSKFLGRPTHLYSDFRCSIKDSILALISPHRQVNWPRPPAPSLEQVRR